MNLYRSYASTPEQHPMDVGGSSITPNKRKSIEKYKRFYQHTSKKGHHSGARYTLKEYLLYRKRIAKIKTFKTMTPEEQAEMRALYESP